MGAILVPLNEVCRKCSSNLRLKDVINGEEGPYPVYGASGIVGYSNSYQIDQEYVAVVKDGAGVGRALKCEANSSVLGTLQPIIPTNSVNRDYLFSVLETLDLAKYTSGSTIPHIYFKDYGKELIPYLDRAGQNLLASRFRTINRALGACNSLIERLDLLVKSRFVEMFGDPCDAGSSSGFPRRRIETFCELRIGPFGSALHKEDYITGGYPVVNPSHIINGQIATDKSLTIDAEKYRLLEPYHLHKGDVVLGRRGEIGRCAVVAEEGMLCGTGSMILRPDESLCRSDYLQRVVSFPSFASLLEEKAVGVTMKNLNAKTVGNAEAVLPPVNLQQEFTSFVVEVDKLRFDVQRQVEKLETLKKSLMQEYFG